MGAIAAARLPIQPLLKSSRDSAADFRAASDERMRDVIGVADADVPRHRRVDRVDAKQHEHTGKQPDTRCSPGGAHTAPPYGHYSRAPEGRLHFDADIAQRREQERCTHGAQDALA
jgi:hypothetical protein